MSSSREVKIQGALFFREGAPRLFVLITFRISFLESPDPAVLFESSRVVAMRTSLLLGPSDVLTPGALAVSTFGRLVRVVEVFTSLVGMCSPPNWSLVGYVYGCGSRVLKCLFHVPLFLPVLKKCHELNMSEVNLRVWGVRSMKTAIISFGKPLTFKMPDGFNYSIKRRGTTSVAEYEEII